MNLNIEKKFVLITQDSIGLCYKISSLLKKVGVTTIITEDQERSRVKQIIKKYDRIDTFINILDSNNTIKLENYKEISVINIGTQKTLRIKGDSYENTFLMNEDKLSNIPKANTIVIPEYICINLEIKTSKKINFNKKSINTQIANTLAFLISDKSKHLNGQLFFIDGGLHLFNTFAY